MSKVIKMACRGAGTLTIDKFIELQGELKTLGKEEFTRLRREIIEHGFSFAVHAWHSPEGVYFILDGHQRLRVVRHLISKEDYSCPEIPYSLVEAQNYQEAKRKLLAAASQYGKVQEQGLTDYTRDMELKPEELANYNFAGMDIDKYIEANFEGMGQLESVEFEAKPEAMKTQFIVAVTCQNEVEMQQLYEELHSRDFECKLIT